MKSKVVARAVPYAVGVSILALSAPVSANNGDPGYLVYDGGQVFDNNATGPAGTFVASSIGLGFNGISQLDVRALHSNFSEIPPDTMGAIGTTQFFETANGAYAVYDKATGTQTKLWTDGGFWAAAGVPASNDSAGFSNGDSRVLFDKPSGKWIVESFGPDLSQVQIAVSNTSDATQGFKSTVFTGFSGGIADYPTLAIDSKAVYIGTNDFGGPNNDFQGTTLNVISRSAIFGAGGPTATDGAGVTQFFTPYTATSEDRGFSIQGVNQVGGSDVGQILASGVKAYGEVSYQVLNPGTPGATQTGVKFVDQTPYDPNNLAAQPDGTRNIDTLDDRLSSAVYEYKGKIYSVHTITEPGADHTELEYLVVDAATGAEIQKGTIGDATHDYFQGSIAINSRGQVLLGFNRSGFDSDGNVTFLAQAFNPVDGGNGRIVASGAELVLKVSPIDNYHNGSTQFADAVGRQRWGDYAQVTVDPNNNQSFWAIGEYALGYLPNPNASFSRWGTWIANVNVAAVPEPGSWVMMIAGFGIVGAASRRRRMGVFAAAPA